MPRGRLSGTNIATLPKVQIAVSRIRAYRFDRRPAPHEITAVLTGAVWLRALRCLRATGEQGASMPQAIQQAVQFRQQGRLGEAERLYREALRTTHGS
jgi:hypothetical protein